MNRLSFLLWLSCFCSIIAANLTAAPLQAQSDEEQRLEQANEITDPSKRLSALKSFLADHPKTRHLPYARWYIFKALIESNGPIEEVMEACEAAVAKMPKEFESDPKYRAMAYGHTARLMNERGAQFDKALQYARKALSLLPADIDDSEAKRLRLNVQVLVGALSVKLNQGVQAIPILLDVVKVAPTYQEAWIQLGAAYEQNDSLDLAIDAYVRAVTIYGAKDKSAEATLRSLYKRKAGSLTGLDEKLLRAREKALRHEALEERRFDAVAPEWELSALNSQTVKSSTLKGKVTVLNFWGTWCPHCPEDLRQFQNLHGKYNGKGVEFIAIDVEEPAAEKTRLETVKRFLANRSYSFTIALDLNDVVAAYYILGKVPSIFVIDRSGVIRYRNEGSSSDLEQILELQIEFLMSDQAAGLPPPPQVDNAQEAMRLFRLASKMYENGIYKGAAKLSERVLSLNEKLANRPDELILTPLALSAKAYSELSDYKQAQAHYERLVSIIDKRGGWKVDYDSQILLSLGKCYIQNGEMRKAEAPLLRALALLTKQAGPDALMLEQALHLIGNYYNGMRNFAKAEEMFQRLADLAMNAKPVKPGKVANSLLNLANLAHSLGNDAKALRLLQQAQSVMEETLAKENNPLIVPILSLQAHIYSESPESGAPEYAKAEKLFQQIQSIYQKYLPPDDINWANLYMNLSLLYSMRDELEKADASIKRAIPIFEKTYGRDHPEYAILLNNLASLEFSRGRYSIAREYYLQVKGIMEKAYGADHYYIGMSLNNLALVYEAEGNIEGAIRSRELANVITERIIARTLIGGSETQKATYMGEKIYDTDYTISFHTQSARSSVQACRVALTTLLQRKGRILDVMTDIVGVIRRRLESGQSDEQGRLLLEEWAVKRSRLATLVMQPPEKTDSGSYGSEIGRLEEEIDRIETKLSTKSEGLRFSSEPVTIEAVQKQIPQDTLLIEYVLYHPFDLRARRFGPARYAVYILEATGEPQMIPLTGDAATVDAAILKLYSGLRNDKLPVSEVNKLAGLVYEVIMRPVLECAGKHIRRLLVSPDGQLNLVPFGALLDDKLDYLINNYAITYLSSGRDLLRLQTQTVGKSGPIIVGSPDFGAGSAIGDPGRQAGSGALRRYFSPLNSSKQELQAIIPKAEVLSGSEASETALRQLHNPRILHITTHGEFLENTQPDSPGTRRSNTGGAITISSAHSQNALLNNPMFTSYIALAGANLPNKDGDDGLLRAAEMATLDLLGTKIVVLAACETGLGGIRNGEGVYGLRRALVLAGSESQIISLWKVDETVTRKFFQSFYDKLLNGRYGRSEALREVQKEMIQNANLRHPYFWAAFIGSGAWHGLSDKQ